MRWKTLDYDKLTPMMQHYISIKRRHPDCIIMYRLGDFYEMFFDDAETASRILELALTERDCGLEERAAMCGVPQHVVETYISRLVTAGQKVAVVDQMENPAEAKGLVKRSVTRIITPGTLTDTDSLNQKENNYLLAVYVHGHRLGIAYTDISTGEISATELKEVQSIETSILDWITTLRPSELLFINDEDFVQKSFLNEVPDQDAIDLAYVEREGIFLTRLNPVAYDNKNVEAILNKYLSKKNRQSMDKHLMASIALATMLDYIYSFQDKKLDHLNEVRWLNPQQVLKMNASTRENLEIHYNINTRSKKHSLLGVMNQTQTAIGSRLLSKWLEFPLLDVDDIEERLDIVDYFYHNLVLQTKINDNLSKIYDLERLLSKFSYNRGNARDMLALGLSLKPLPALKVLLSETDSPLLKKIGDDLDTIQDVAVAIEKAIEENPPLTLTEGGLIKTGYDEKLDHIRQSSDRARERLLNYEVEEQERTGIKNLRVVFKKNMGYFIEVTNSNLQKIPDDYRRRQTLKNAERFLTDELEEQTRIILGSEQAIFDYEYNLFQELRSYIGQQTVRIQTTAETIGRLDVLLSFAKVAKKNNYVRPVFHDSDEITIKNGRHPVVEQTSSQFIGNDLEIGDAGNRIHIITGPNMAGKSTYMRQNALIVLMAQVGSFVPADSCHLPITDQIFTRIGALDNLASGDSTFMVEMKEMANILRDATNRSFLILDEVGRGTSTNDGLSIAYAIVEYLSRETKAKTLFATHYHELTALSDQCEDVQNKKVDIEEQGGDLLFLRKVIDGKADKSYGIEVARLSGLPQEVLQRASYLLTTIDEGNELNALADLPEQTRLNDDFTAFEKDTIIRELQDINIEELSPIQALNLLNQFVLRSQDVD